MISEPPPSNPLDYRSGLYFWPSAWRKIAKLAIYLPALPFQTGSSVFISPCDLPWCRRLLAEASLESRLPCLGTSTSWNRIRRPTPQFDLHDVPTHGIAQAYLSGSLNGNTRAFAGEHLPRLPRIFYRTFSFNYLTAMCHTSKAYDCDYFFGRRKRGVDSYQITTFELPVFRVRSRIS